MRTRDSRFIRALEGSLCRVLRKGGWHRGDVCGSTARTQSLLRNEDTKEKRKAEREGGRAGKEGRRKGKREGKKGSCLGTGIRPSLSFQLDNK